MIDKTNCPVCGADFTNQTGYNPEAAFIHCKECGKLITETGVFSGPPRFCEECGMLLNEQNGFSHSVSTWICLNCFHSNDLPAPKNEEPKQPASEYASPEPIPPKAETVEDEEEEPDYSHLVDVGKKKKLTREERRQRRTARLDRFFKISKIIFFSIIAVVIALVIFELTKLQAIGYSSEEIIGKPYKEVVADLEGRGFTRVETVEEQELNFVGSLEEGSICGVELKYKKEFTESSKYPSNFKIIIHYKTVKKITPPMEQSALKKVYYRDVLAKFEEAGFTNIKVKPLNDVTLGWFKKQDETDHVTIGGQTNWKASTEFRPDSEVVIYYHSK